VGRNAWRYLRELLSASYLYVLAVGLLGAPAMLRRRGVGLLAAVALFNFLAISLVWAVHEPARLLQPVFVYLLPLCIGAPLAAFEWIAARGYLRSTALAIGRILVRIAVPAACLVVVLWCYPRELRRERETSLAAPATPISSPAQQDWTDSVLLPDAVIATDAPFLCNWRVDRPTVRLPVGLNDKNAVDFLRKYGAAVIALRNSEEPKWRDHLEGLLRQGLLQQFAGGCDPNFQWFHVNENVFFSSETTAAGAGAPK
jgi:hypothetical protein